jgi:quinoprotein relay system zinc metallohydrolase 2
VTISRRSVLYTLAGLGFAAAPAAADNTFTLEEFAPGVFIHVPRPALVSKANQGDIANLGIVIGGEAIAVIDTGGSPAIGRKFLAAVQAVSAKPIRYVINTHVHPDHIFGNVAFEGLGAVFAGHKNLPRAIAGTQQHYLASYQEQMGPELMADMQFVVPTLLVEEETTIDLGNRQLTLKAWPAAHTDSDLTVYDEASRTIFTGDLLFRQHIPVLDGSLKGWIEVMDGLGRIPAERVVPGHGRAGEPWPDALRPQRAYFERLEADLRNDIEKGQSLGEAIKTAGASERGNWELFDDYNPRNASQAFKELEWE